MGVIERHLAMLASWRLRKKLARSNPGAFIYGGISVQSPYQLRIYCDQELVDVPERFKHDGIDYPVVFSVRGND